MELVFIIKKNVSYVPMNRFATFLFLNLKYRNGKISIMFFVFVCYSFVLVFVLFPFIGPIYAMYFSYVEFNSEPRKTSKKSEK